jgi:hypothetical protein
MKWDAVVIRNPINSPIKIVNNTSVNTRRTPDVDHGYRLSRNWIKKRFGYARKKAAIKLKKVPFKNRAMSSSTEAIE